ncbi:hypothetical protein [Plantibacter cousiniae (nom. nud.)]|uniref:hypothetical protein n=1 Tax=Plantibacter cousiniae (nom. nud.) TaxID=199709 RepID=UPI001D4ABD2A|nr:hypothetical protein [Plantibacter cousiniae]CAH0266250.1 hypothetical protein SRABI02_03553 [Plantibacter cousiniae]
MKAGAGRRLPMPQWRDQRASQAEDLNDRNREAHGLPVIDAWRREHDTCTPDAADIIMKLTKLAVTPDEARRTAERFGHPLIAVHRWAGSPAPMEVASKPFGWLSADDLDATVQVIWGDTRPTVVEEGGCGMCGARASIGWWESPLRWTDGTKAAMCSTCGDAWVTAGRPVDMMTGDPMRPGLRRVALRLLAGATSVPETDFGLRLFAEIASPSERGDYATAWTYRPTQLDAVRDRVWLYAPRYAPADRVDEYTARQAAAEEERARELHGQTEASRAEWDRSDWATS